MFDTLRAKPIALALAAAAFAAPVAMPAQAADAQVRVQFDDLDLSSPAGQRVLEQRLDRAARQVCGLGQHVTGSNIPSRSATTCYQQTKAQLTEQFAERVKNDERRGG